MKTGLALIALALAGVASSPVYGLADTGAAVPAVGGNLRHLDETPPETTSETGDMSPDDYEAKKHWPGGGCYPGSWRWPRCRWDHGCYPGSWRWPRCRWGW